MSDRREFLFEALGLILGNALADPDEDSFLLEVGCLWCDGSRWGRHYILAFTIYLERRRQDGATMLRRMLPTALLRDKLCGIGVPVEFDGEQIYPALIGTTLIGPAQLLQRMEEIMNGCDWTALYFDPAAWEWGEFDGQRKPD